MIQLLSQVDEKVVPVEVMLLPLVEAVVTVNADDTSGINANTLVSTTAIAESSASAITSDIAAQNALLCMAGLRIKSR